MSALTYSSFPAALVSTISDAAQGVKSAVMGKERETRLRGAVKAIGAAGTMGGIPGTSQGAQWLRNTIQGETERKRRLGKLMNHYFRRGDTRENREAAWNEAQSKGLLKKASYGAQRLRFNQSWHRRQKNEKADEE